MGESPHSADPGLTQALTELRRLEHVPAAHVALLEGVAAAQWRAGLSLHGPYPDPDPETAARMLAHGFYLIDFNRLRLDSPDLDKL
jgi:hypothetical protein